MKGMNGMKNKVFLIPSTNRCQNQTWPGCIEDNQGLPGATCSKRVEDTHKLTRCSMACVGRRQPQTDLASCDFRWSCAIMVSESMVGKWERDEQESSCAIERGRFEEMEVVRNWPTSTTCLSAGAIVATTFVALLSWDLCGRL